MQKRLRKEAVEKLLRQTRQLQQQLETFERTARDVAGPLDTMLSKAEIAEMATVRANLLGTLECLLYQDLGGLLKQLGELDGLLRPEVGEAA